MPTSDELDARADEFFRDAEDDQRMADIYWRYGGPRNREHAHDWYVSMYHKIDMGEWMSDQADAMDAQEPVWNDFIVAADVLEHEAELRGEDAADCRENMKRGSASVYEAESAALYRVATMLRHDKQPDRDRIIEAFRACWEGARRSGVYWNDIMERIEQGADPMNPNTWR